MTFSPEAGNLVKISTGVFWSLAYLLIIRRGFKDRTFGMPLVAACANISWELIFSFIHPHNPPQLYIDITWFMLDLLIVYQVLRYGPRSFDDLLPKGSFYAAFAVTLALSFAITLGITIEFKDWIGGYSAFGMNLIMSILFVVMLRRRNDLGGQSLYIALAKWTGTLLVSVYFYVQVSSSFLMVTLYVAIFFFDALYTVLLYAKHREMGVSPWRRA